jgi:acetyl esterase/lipase
MGLLCILKAPVYILWFIAILVEEFPWIFVICNSLLLLWGLKVQRFQVAGNYLAGVSLLMFLYPIASAWFISRNLNDELTMSFGPRAAQTTTPFSLTGMIALLAAPKVDFKTVMYANKENESLTFDYYHSQKAGTRPVIIVIHGGSWAAGDSKQLPELNSVLALQGYNVASINYRLAPKFQSPAPVEDVASAIDFLKKNSAEYSVDTTSFILLGRSAGGQIALSAAYTLKDRGIIGVVGFYAPSDMVWGYSQPANPLIMDSRKVMEDYLGGTYSAVPDNYVQSSAIDFVTPATVPTLLIHGKNDVLVFHEHSVRLSKKLKENNVPYYFLSLPWATHGCDYTLTGPGGQLSTYSVLAFLRATTDKSI